MSKDEGLSVGELLRNTYDRLAERHSHQELVLPKETFVEIAKDSDHHRTRVGYMVYERAKSFQFGDRTWAVFRGMPYGSSYLVEPYDSDLLALELPIEGKTPEQTTEELRTGIKKSTYFSNSLVYGKDDGNLSLNPNGRFGKKMLELLSPEIPEFIAQEPEYDTSVVLASTLQPLIIKLMLYKPEFVDFLADTIETVLKE